VDVIKRMTARLGFDPATANAARHTALRAHELAGAADVPWAGRNPATVAGAVAVAVHLLTRVKADEARAKAAVAAGGAAAAAAGAGGRVPVAAGAASAVQVPAEISWSEFNAKVGMASQTLRTALQDMQPWLTTFVSFGCCCFRVLGGRRLFFRRSRSLAHTLRFFLSPLSSSHKTTKNHRASSSRRTSRRPSSCSSSGPSSRPR
jgi:hypothetical protein